MREIKVRGYALEKLITDTQWLVGFGVCEIKFADHYAKEVGRISDWWIYTENGEYLVDPKSIGEYTGLLDKNGKEIYEGDIIYWEIDNGVGIESYTAVVRCSESNDDYKGMYKWIVLYLVDYLRGSFDELSTPAAYNDGLEVIGNIYENPELLNS